VHIQRENNWITHSSIIALLYVYAKQNIIDSFNLYVHIPHYAKINGCNIVYLKKQKQFYIYNVFYEIINY